MSTVLVRPDGKNEQYGALRDLSAIEPPLWMALLANHYKPTRLVDREVNKSEITEKDVYIIATGNHPSAHIQQRKAAEKLRKKLGRGKIIDKLPVNPIKLGSPRWDMLDMTKYRAHNWHTWGQESRKPYGIVYTSINCPFSCSFCVIHDFYSHKYEKRSTADIIKDFKVMAEHGITNIKMMDEIFLRDTSQIQEVLKAIEGLAKWNIWGYARVDMVNRDILKRARQAGVTWLCYGFETSDEDLRNSLRKGKFSNQQIIDVVEMTKDCGINVLGNFMFGFIGEDRQQMVDTYKFAEKLNCEYANFYCYVDYNQTKEVSQYSPNFKSKARNFRDRAFNTYFNNGKYLDLVEKKFGVETVKSIKKMLSIKLERK